MYPPANSQHSVYSAYEHSLLTSSPSSSSSTSSLEHSLPLDITIETLLSLLLLSAGIVLGSPALRPIQWHEWAASVESEDKLPPEERRELVARKVKGKDGGGIAGNPFGGLDGGRRNGFLDIRVSFGNRRIGLREGARIRRMVTDRADRPKEKSTPTG
jgi:membrane magnesium transporter 1